MNKHSDNFKYKDEDKIRELRAKGYGYSDIARELGRNRKNICKTCRREKDREAWRINDIKRRANTKRVERDKDITLGKLFERDKGVCYLCGNKCDWNDGAWINGAFIVGRNYPTIDHVVALANGGSHTWKNIRLAHLSCNSKKGKRDAKLTAPMSFF